jgi:hypothetical protein
MPIWRPSFISQLRQEDRCHLNGFAEASKEIRYVTALSATDDVAGWQGARCRWNLDRRTQEQDHPIRSLHATFAADHR